MAEFGGVLKNQWVTRIIGPINRVIKELHPTVSYRAAYVRWLDAGSLMKYRQLFEAVFLNHGIAPEHLTSIASDNRLLLQLVIFRF